MKILKKRLRVSIAELQAVTGAERWRIQLFNKGIDRLTNEQREKLRKYLLEIIEELNENCSL
jgi:ribosomal protein S3AE